MTDQEIKNLARKYAEENPPQTEDEKLKEIGMFLNATEVFEPFLYWLKKTHCIVSREKVIDEYKAAKADVEFENEINDSSHMNQALGGMAVLQELFGTELFEERSGE